jgi:hypothetical protein
MNLVHSIKSSLIPIFAFANFLPVKQKKRLLLIGVIALACLALIKYQNNKTSVLKPSQNIKLLSVHYDAGETNAMLPVLKQLELEGVDFRVLVLGTAETIIKPEMFKGRRLTLKDLQVDTVVDTTTDRTVALSQDMMKKFQMFNPKVVLVGSVSRIQQQVLECFSHATTVALIDDFSYDKQQKSFSTVDKVQAAAKHVLCPSQHTSNLFLENQKNAKSHPEYHVVGKPSLEVWEKEIKFANHEKILKTLNFTKDRPIITFIGGYGPGYDVINPLFNACRERLKKEGFQVIQQSHPKIASPIVKTTDALAVSHYVVGYNSSVIFDCALVGVCSLFFIPDNAETQFKHFAIDAKLITKVSNVEELLVSIRSEKTPVDIRAKMGIPQRSIVAITQLLHKWMDETSTK